MAGDGTHTYQWDGENRLVSVDGVAGQSCQATWTACYYYNALGQRVEKQVAQDSFSKSCGFSIRLGRAAASNGGSCAMNSRVPRRYGVLVYT